MRFLVDECVSRRIVDRLRTRGDDVLWGAERHSGDADPDVLRRSWEEGRILLTADRGFGELAIRLGQPAIGIAVLAASQFAGDPDEVADALVGEVTRLGDQLTGKLPIIEARRVRQRDLVAWSAAEEDY